MTQYGEAVRLEEGSPPVVFPDFSISIAAKSKFFSGDPQGHQEVVEFEVRSKKSQVKFQSTPGRETRFVVDGNGFVLESGPSQISGQEIPPGSWIFWRAAEFDRSMDEASRLPAPSAEEIRQARPAKFKPIESCLDTSLPRQGEFFDGTGRGYHWHPVWTDLLAVVTAYPAVKGWVVKTKPSPDPDLHEAWLAYEWDGKTYSHYLKAEYDAHAINGVVRWCREALHAGNSITLLVNPADPVQAKVFAMLEAYVQKDGKAVWAAMS